MVGYLKHVICQKALDRAVLYRHSYLFVAEILAMNFKSDPNIKSININSNEIKSIQHADNSTITVMHAISFLLLIQ